MENTAKNFLIVLKNLLKLTRAPETFFKKEMKKQVEATRGWNGDEIANKITKVSKKLPQNNSGTVESETEILKERYISLERGR